MKEKKILLISFDKEYVDKILSELPFVLNDSSELIVISNEEYFSEYCKQGHPKVDVLIADEYISREALFSQPADTTYYLVENTEAKNHLKFAYNQYIVKNETNKANIIKNELEKKKYKH